MAAELAALERDGRVTETALRRPAAPLRRPGRLHPRPAGRLGAVRSRLRPGRVDQAADRAVRRRADAGGAGPPGHRGPRPAAARRAHQPPRPRRPRVARGPPARRTGSLLVASHDRAFLDATVTRVWELRDRQAHGVPRRLRAPTTGSARSATPGRSRTPTRTPSRSRASASSSSATAAIASSRRCTSTRPASSACRPRRAMRPRSRRQLALPQAALAGERTVAQRRDRRPRRGPRRRLPAGSRRRAARRHAGHARHRSSPGCRSSPRSEASASASSARTARARRRSCAPSPVSCRRSTGRSRSGTTPSSATWPSCAVRPSRAPPCSTRCSRRSRSRAGEARGVPGPLPVPRRRRVQGGPLPVRRRAIAARDGDPRHPALEPAAARRADEPPRHPGPRGDRGVPARDRRPRCSSSPTTGACSRPCATGCGSSGTGSATPFDGGYRAWRQAIAAGWTVARASPSRPTGCGREHANRRRRPDRPGTGATAGGWPAAGRGSGAARGARPVRPRPPGPPGRYGHVGTTARRGSPEAQGREAVQGRLQAPEGRPRGRADAPRACARTTSSWRWAIRPSPPTSSSCAGSRASSPTWTRALAAAEDQWLELEERAP